MKHSISKVCLSVAAMAVAGIASAQLPWVRQSSLPTDQTPKGVFALSATRAFVVGSNQLILETTTAGNTWKTVGLGEWGTDPHYNVYFPTPNVGIITGNNGGLRTTDSGATWSTVSTLPAGSWLYIDFVSPTVGFAGANGACAATTDGGVTWSVRSGYPTCPVMFGMDFVDANIGLVGGIMAGTTDEGIYKTTDGGQTWVKKATVAANDVLWMSSTRAIADQGTSIRESLDAGNTWHPLAFGISSGIVTLEKAGASNTVIGVSGKGDVWRSTNGGVTWVQTFDGPGALPDIWEASFADELHGWIVGPGAFLYYTSDGGVTWQQKNTGCNAQITDIQMLDANYGLATGRNGYLFRTTNGGSFWEVKKLEVTGQIFGRDEDLVAIDVVDRDFAVAAGPGGTVFKTEDGGNNWTSIGYPVLSTLFYIYDVDFVDHNLGYVYGVDHDLGHTKTLFRTRNGGATWEWVDLGQRGGGTTVNFVDANHGWLTADNTYGLKTVDGGVTWTEFNMPTYFSGPEVSMVRFRNQNEGWAVGWNGYVAKTSNGGSSWQLVDLGTIEDNIYDVTIVSSSEVWLCGREDWSFAGVIYHSLNGGQTWARQVVTDWFYYPYRMTALPSGDAWFGGANGTIFRRPMSAHVEPTTYAIQPGIHLGGGLTDLFQSDDRYLSMGPQYAIPRSLDPIALQIEGVSATATPTSLELILETRVTTAGVRQAVELWDFVQSQWVLVQSVPAPQSDTAATLTAPGSLARFVQPGTRKMRAQVRWRPSDASARSWSAFCDRAVWRISP